uniref:Uncharacterized protein n=1 Tax=Anguilla anguilla TaxID=7936 RepID=A0A0E9UQP3_ANGAN
MISTALYMDQCVPVVTTPPPGH